MPHATKRKRVSGADVPRLGVEGVELPPQPKRRASARSIATAAVAANPDLNKDVIDAPDALRASPDSDINEDIVPTAIKREDDGQSQSLPSNAQGSGESSKKKKSKAKVTKTKREPGDSAEPAGPEKKRSGKQAVKKEAAAVSDETPKPIPAKKVKQEANGEAADPEAEGDEEPNEEEVKEALSRPPPINSDYLPLPWKGRLGYACLNSYLRNSNPPVFSSRTCRIQSILEHRHPLQDESQPEHATKNRPDKSKPADVARGQRYVEALCLANIKDITKMVRWNERYNIRFFRLSSEMFPFASHPEYGYRLGPFASDALAEAGKVIAELGHRVTVHPGQFTQLGSPRPSVIDNAIRDLEYHDELLTLLKLPEQLNKDAIMVLHMGGMFESKEATLQRFREKYATLSQSIKNRLVLENDDMGWSVHDLLPVCEELNIPMVLDFHHHNIVFDPEQIREGTKDIIELFPRIKATWERKGIRQKMHYSEPTPPAVTKTQRRKHNPRVASLPPCPPDMDLMIEAKDKEQAVFELMRTFKLPGFDQINDILPYTRNDDNKVALATMNKKKKNADEPEPILVPEDEVGMGGAEGRVYWPPTMEEWLRPKKREVKKKSTEEKTTAQIKKVAAELYAAREAEKRAEQNPGVKHEDDESDLEATPATRKAKAAMRKKARAAADKIAIKEAAAEMQDSPVVKSEPVVKKEKKSRAKKQPQPVPTPSESDDFDEEESGLSDDEEEEDDEDDRIISPVKRPAMSRQPSRRSGKSRVSYKEEDDAMADVE